MYLPALYICLILDAAALYLQSWSRLSTSAGSRCDVCPYYDELWIKRTWVKCQDVFFSLPALPNTHPPLLILAFGTKF